MEKQSLAARVRALAGLLVHEPDPSGAPLCRDDCYRCEVIAIAAELERIAEASQLKRNSRWAADKLFDGEWIVIPLEDFNRVSALAAALADPKEEA